MTIDNRQMLETPEGIDLPLYPAGIWIRILAYLVDWLIRAVATAVIAGVVGVVFWGHGVGQAIILVSYFLLEWFYPVAFDLWRGGQTPGKKSLGLKVVNDDGTPITLSASMLRNLLRTIDFLPLFYVAGIFTSVCNRDFKRLGDLAAGTLVVYTRPSVEQPQLEDVGVRAVPPDFDADEQRMLLAFAQRSATMSTPRQEELASILSPLLGYQQPARTIKQMANAIVGKR